ncbi:MAG: lysine--tRNA ligase [Heyndrickxia sp.]
MHWAFQIAKNLMEKYPSKNVFTCASGISPSGSVHIGNFREIVTTFFVVKALESLGKKTRFIFSWDDFDRLRKVPQNVAYSFDSYIGMPYSEVPSPSGKGSYAQYFEKELENSLQAFGIKPQFIYQSKEYRSGRYLPYIQIAMEKRKEIYDILMRFKTEAPSIEEREAFYPLSLYCQNCNKDTTTITFYDENTGKLEYKCNCGFKDIQALINSNNLKLSWKVDWAVRGRVEEVIFEPGGRDHSSATGSYNVSKIIAKEIFDYEAPEYMAYDFIGLKGTKDKMSSSSGNVITPDELLKVYTPELILFLFAKYKPSSAFNIGLDEDVIRNFSELNRYRTSYQQEVLKDKDIKSSLELAGIKTIIRHPNFNQVAGIFPLIDFNRNALQKSLWQNGESFTIEEIRPISDRVSYWIKHWNPHRLVKINQKRNTIYYKTLSEGQKEKIDQLARLLLTEQTLSGIPLLNRIYALCHQENKKSMRDCQKKLFEDVYQLLINEDNGPRLPLLFSAIGREKVIELLTFS